MKINCGPTKQERNKPLTEWHRHFAWWPVRVSDRDCRWFEHVERRYGWIGRYSGNAYDPVYRALGDK